MFAQLLIIFGFLVLHSTYAVPNGRIVGGVNANIGQFPFQVSLQVANGGHICGGSILNKNYIITAAHCVVIVENEIESYNAEYFEVRVGSIQHASDGQLLQLKRVIVNENYGDYLNDIALLELQQPLVFTSDIQPIELATEEVPSGEDVIISGWGRLYYQGPRPEMLQWNTLKALTTAQCADAIGVREDSLICLAHSINNGSCNGDSGGPAIYKGKLVGVSGFVLNGCGSEYPDGYAKIAFHRDWILSKIGQ